MNQLHNIMANVFNVASDAIDTTISMKDASYWDSLTHMHLIVSIEKEFDVSLSSDEMIRMTSITAIEEVLIEKGVLIHGE